MRADDLTHVHPQMRQLWLGRWEDGPSSDQDAERPHLRCTLHATADLGGIPFLQPADYGQTGWPHSPRPLQVMQLIILRSLI